MANVVSAPVDVTTQTILPDWYTNYAMDVLAAQQGVSGRPYQAYVDAEGKPIQQIAELTPLQQAGIEAAAQGANIFRPELGLASQQAQNVLGRNASQNIQGALSALGATASGRGLSGATPYLQRAVNTDIMGAAQPYAQRAGVSTVRDIQDYMNPYTQEVVYRLGDIGARTLREQLLPQIMSKYISSGQGLTPSGRSVDEARALRDVYESVLAKQAELLQQGYTQAAGLSAADLARYGQLANVMGGLAGQEAQTALGAGQAYGNIGTAEQRIAADVAQAQAQQQAAAYQADTANQMAAAAALQSIAQQRQQQELAAAGALQTAGATQQQLDQKALDLARAEFERQQAYPQQQINAAAGTAGALAGAVPTATQKTGIEPLGVQPSANTAGTVLGGLAAAAGLGLFGSKAQTALGGLG